MVVSTSRCTGTSLVCLIFSRFKIYQRLYLDQILSLPDRKTVLISEALCNVHMALQAPNDEVVQAQDV